MKNLELIGEHWRDNIVGLTWNQRLERAIHARAQAEANLWLSERLRRNPRSPFARMHETAICAVLNQNRRILDVGFNKPNDLILNNFGAWLAGIIQPPTAWAQSTTLATVTMTDVSGTSRTVGTYTNYVNSASCNLFNCYYSAGGVAAGTQLQVGSSTAAAARTQYAIQTGFGTAPESGRFSTSPGSYSSGYVSLSGAVTAGGSGTVNETGLFGFWSVILQTTGYAFMLFRDVLGAGVSFVAGNILNVSYSIAL